MQGKVAAIGDADFVMPFSALGLDTFAVGVEPGDVGKSAAEILDGGYGLVVVAENVAAEADEVFSEEAKAAVPCVVVVPFTTGSQGYATAALGEVLRMATGINILQKS